MNDKDYILKAVELADGWFLWDLGRRAICKTFRHLQPHGHTIKKLPEWMLAALAAQLAEQIDAHEPLRLVERRGFTAIRRLVKRGTNVINWKEEDMLIAYGPDRFMNAIKVAVDIGVLR